MNDKILIVDDDPAVRKSLTELLFRDNFSVESIENGTKLLDVLNKSKFDLILLDVLLPGEDGFNLAKNIRKTFNIPIIFISGRGDETDKVVGLEIGADDYITKPFRSRELIARVRSVIRRSKISTETQIPNIHVFKFEGWSINLKTFELISPNKESIPVTSYEFLILALFVENPHKILSKNIILDKIADREWNPNDRAVDFAIMNLRRKLGDNAKKPKFIKTIRNEGYVFISDVDVDSSV